MARNTNKRSPEEQQLWELMESVRTRLKAAKALLANEQASFLTISADDDARIVLVGRRIIHAHQALSSLVHEIETLETKYSAMRSGAR